VNRSLVWTSLLLCIPAWSESFVRSMRWCFVTAMLVSKVLCLSRFFFFCTCLGFLAPACRLHFLCLIISKCWVIAICPSSLGVLLFLWISCNLSRCCTHLHLVRQPIFWFLLHPCSRGVYLVVTVVCVYVPCTSSASALGMLLLLHCTCWSSGK
jgi:hypothetical protein